METELEVLFSDRFRRIWIQTTRLGSVCVTLFPVDIHQRYRIVTRQGFGELTIERLTNLINENN
jgi:hypothetical protein